MAYITCENVTLGYEGKAVLENVNFSVSEGDYLCIVGENGSGKSTLIKGLLGIKKPMEGQILYGDDLKENEIGYLPQQSLVQKNFPASVFEVVRSGCLNQLKWKPFYGAADRKRALEMMDLMDIRDLKDTSYQELSGGQQQRVLLARALCATHKMLLLDEPVTGLDPLVAAEMYQLIQKINRDRDITIIMISHDMDAAVKYASHILQLDNKQLFFGPTADYLKTGAARVLLGGEEDA